MVVKEAGQVTLPHLAAVLGLALHGGGGGSGAGGDVAVAAEAMTARLSYELKVAFAANGLLVEEIAAEAATTDAQKIKDEATLVGTTVNAMAKTTPSAAEEESAAGAFPSSAPISLQVVGNSGGGGGGGGDDDDDDDEDL